MSIDGLGRSSGIVGGGLPGEAGKVDAPQKSGGAGNVDPKVLLEAQRLMGGAGGNRESAGLGKPGKFDAAAAAASLGSLTDTQVSADIYSFMALFQKMAQQMRDTARTQRSGEMQAQVTALQGAAEKMKDAATHRFTAAVVQGAFQIAGGVASMGLSGMSMAKTIKGANLEVTGKNNLEQMKSLEMGTQSRSFMTQGANSQEAAGKVMTAKGQNLQNFATASGGIAGGVGSMVGAAFTYKADIADADKANLETQAKVHETGVQHANDMMQQMMDVIRDVRDKLQSIQQSAVETNRGIARNI